LARKKGIQNEITINSSVVMFEYWAFTIVLSIIAISGLFLIRDWMYSTFEVYGDVYIPTPLRTRDVHFWAGIIFCALGILHLSYHFGSKKKEIIPIHTKRDFKAFIHSGMYLVGISRRDDIGTGEKYNGRQRITYMALLHILGLAAITGFLYFFGFLTHSTSIVHALPAGLAFMVLFFVFLFTIRKHDSVPLKSKFTSGSLPLWYIRKNHPMWYVRLKTEGKIPTASGLAGSTGSGTAQRISASEIDGDDFTKAVAKFVQLQDENPDDKAIMAISDELRETLSKKDRARIMELAKEL
jgi:hypothetical protein